MSFLPGAGMALLVAIAFIACSKSQAQTAKVDLGDGVEMEFVLIKAGTFLMGSELETGDGDETPQHEVRLSRPYYLGKYEVTQAQWEKIMADNPSRFKGPKRPVESVSWNECQLFLKKLEEKTQHRFALPTEAQWEYACRAGTKSHWSFGERSDAVTEFAWMEENSGETTHPVGEKKSNRWGLHDMVGNVAEWCQDWYANPYPSGPLVDPQGPPTGESRVLRGGAWGDHPDNLRPAGRNCLGPEGAHDGIGFRCVMIIAEARD